MALNAYSRLSEEVESKPVTLPTYIVREPDVERTIKDGAKAWAGIQKSESLDKWLAIGRALGIGRSYSLRVSGSNRPTGAQYTRCFSEWTKKNGFGSMPQGLRSCVIELAISYQPIVTWLNTLPKRKRQGLHDPRTIVHHWRAATKPRAKPDCVQRTETALRYFLSCMNKLTPDEAAPLWQTVQAEIAGLSLGD